MLTSQNFSGETEIIKGKKEREERHEKGRHRKMEKRKERRNKRKYLNKRKECISLLFV
jgi:hypothetical protein